MRRLFNFGEKEGAERRKDRVADAQNRSRMAERAVQPANRADLMERGTAATQHASQPQRSGLTTPNLLHEAARESRPATEAARTAVAEMMAQEIRTKEQARSAQHHAQNTHPAQAIAGAQNSITHAQDSQAAAVAHGRAERRHRRRVRISAPVRVRQVNGGNTAEHPAARAAEFDLTMTSDVSREGILFETSRSSYARGQEVAVVFPYRPGPGDPVREQRGQVVRVVRASESRHGVAVAFLEGEPKYELVSSNGRPMFEEKTETRRPAAARLEERNKPLVLVVDADEQTRAMLRSEFDALGYAVETVPDPSMAVALLRHRTPAALVCEAEPFAGVMPGGGDMSGYDLCVIVRRNAKLSRLPVILTTRTGLPSDFATAHALGATVCVAKPYDMGRLTNLLTMLAPVK